MKIYVSEILIPSSEEGMSYLLKMVDYERKMKEEMENDFFNWVVAFHEFIRKKFDLPQKVFCFETLNDKIVRILLFDVEPKNHYKVEFDKEENLPYIEV